MWRRTYLLLLVIRVYFALSPSYLHPDENFQGPEVFAGKYAIFPFKKLSVDVTMVLSRQLVSTGRSRAPLISMDGLRRAKQYPHHKPSFIGLN